jgi:hypothetical protein
MQTIIRRLLPHAGVSLVLAVFGCSRESDDQGTSATMDTVGDTTMASPGSGADLTTDDTADDGVDADTSGGDTSGGSGRAKEACQQACQTMVACERGDREELALCVEDCTEEDELDGACDEATAELYTCLTGLSCAELEDYWEELSDPYPCQTEEKSRPRWRNPDPG